jgi:hypothetical protein
MGFTDRVLKAISQPLTKLTIPGLTGQQWTYQAPVVMQGTVATALSIEGTHATAGISITGTHVSGQAIIIGTGISTPVTFTGNNLVEWHGRVSGATSSDPLLRCRCSAPASTAMTGGRVQSGQFQAYGTDTSDIGALLALEGVVGIKAASSVIGTSAVLPDMIAAWFKCEDLGNTITVDGSSAVLGLGWQFGASSTFTGDTAWIKLMKEGADTTPLDSFLQVYDGSNGGFATNLITMDNAAAPATVSAGTYSTADGYFTISVNSVTYRMPFYAAVD